MVPKLACAFDHLGVYQPCSINRVFIDQESHRKSAKIRARGVNFTFTHTTPPQQEKREHLIGEGEECIAVLKMLYFCSQHFKSSHCVLLKSPVNYIKLFKFLKALDNHCQERPAAKD